MKKEKQTSTKKLSMRRSIYAILLLVLFLWSAGGSAQAQAQEYNINNSPVNISTSGDYLVYGGGGQTGNTITVNGGATANITIRGINIKTNNCAFQISPGATVNLTLRGTNILSSGDDGIEAAPGLEVPSGATLEITAESDGSLTTSGGYGGAGIGGNFYSSVGDIRIAGGTVTANGSDNLDGGGGAGIGSGGNTYSGGTIEISGGNVIANGSGALACGGAGIGGKGVNISISGGDVTATGNSGGAGVGSNNCSDACNIQISGGVINATGNDGGAGIGGGEGEGSVISISGGDVTATGNGGGAGIGGGNGGAGGTVKIAGGTITATGNGGSAGVGDGNGGTGGTIEITGGSVKMSGAVSLRPTNGSVDVYLNTLTIGNPAVAEGLAVKAGNIGGANCIDGVPAPADVDAGKYGIHDVFTLAGGQVYFYLPATNDDNETVSLTVAGKEYINDFARQTNDMNAETLPKRPVVTNVAPSGSGIPTADNVTLSFDKKMSADLTDAEVTLNGVALNLDDVNWSANEATVTIPYSALSYRTTYVIRFSGFKDKDGQTIAPVTSDAYTFVTVDSYTASTDRTAQDFGAMEFGYGAVAPQTFVVTNTGTGALTQLKAILAGPDAAMFEITANPAGSLASGSRTTVGIRPLDNLPARATPYYATLQLTSAEGFTLSVDLLLKVDKALPKPEYLDYRLPEGFVLYDGLAHGIATAVKAAYASQLGAITVKYNDSENVPSEPGKYIVTVEFAGSANYAAGTIEIGSFIIYNPPRPFVPRKVTIEPTPYFDVHPAPGSFYVESGTNLTLMLTPRPSLPEGYTPRVTTNRTTYSDNSSGIRITPNDDGTYTVRIAYIITETIVIITAAGPSSMADDGPTANDSSAALAPAAAWGYAGRLYVRSATEGRAAVYNLSGQLLQTLPLAAGETRSHPLPAGLYIVRTDDGRTYKVALH